MRRPCLLALSCLLLGLSLPLAAQPAESPAPELLVTLTGVHVTPEALRPDLLCRLAVDIRNDGDQIISQLEFGVRLADSEIPVYRNQVFMEALPPGETTRVKLYNFWSTETSRSGPKGKTYPVEVTLRGAKWYRIEDVEEEGETIEEWTPLDEVQPLPPPLAVQLPWQPSN